MSDQQQVYTMGRIARLLLKRLKGESTPDEDQTLDNWLSQQDLLTREFIDNITEPEEIEQALTQMGNFDTRSAFEDVKQRILATTGKAFPTEKLAEASATETGSPAQGTTTYYPDEPAPVRTLWQRYRWLAAASVIAILAGIGIFLANRKPTATAPLATAPQTERYRNDVAPGGDKAILKLADGTSIVLDSAANGILAQQGNTKVVKLEDGQVSYATPKTTNAAATEMTYNTISTPRGGQYQIKLADGSKVWLNAGSSIRFPTAFAADERKVDITGEAYFEIAKDAARPFKVTIAPTGAMKAPQEIEVLGTEFNIMAYSDEATQRTTLVSGSIKIRHGSEEKLIKPSQQVRLANKKEENTMQVETVDPEEITAWKNGLFEFNDTDIAAIMRQIARWYDVEIIYQDDVKNELIGKVPRSMTISNLLKVLESTGQVHFAVEGKKITVMR